MNSQLIDKFTQQKQTYLELNKQLEKNLGSFETLKKLIQEKKQKIIANTALLEKYVQVVRLLQLVAEKAQCQITKVEKICSDALKDVLQDTDLDFKIKTEKKRNSIETSFYIYDRKIGDNVNLMTGEAGGTKNVIAIGLRLVFAELCNPKVEGPIILDEAGGNISTEYQESFGKFLKKFSSLTGRQIILVSHCMPVIAEANRKIAVSKRGNESCVTIL